jgi:hypothetical protein
MQQKKRVIESIQLDETSIRKAFDKIESINRMVQSVREASCQLELTLMISCARVCKLISENQPDSNED